MAHVKKTKRGSIKSKKSWRRKTDIAEVEEHLEDVRFDERTGGPVSDKPNEDLFYVEKKAETVAKVKRKKERVGIEVDDDDDEEYVPKKKCFENKLKREADEEMERRKMELRQAGAKEIWGQEVMTVTEAFLDSTVKKPKVKPKTVGIGKSNVPAVIVDDGGASYNPDYESHQLLLLKAHEEELKILKEQERLNKKVHMVSVEQLKKQSKLWLKEMSEGLSPSDLKGDQECEDEVTVAGVIPAPVTTDNRKTKQQRRKQLLQKQLERNKLESKHNKAKMNDILRLKSLKREIRQMDNKNSSSQKGYKKKRLDRPKRLGLHKFVEPKVAVQLSDELSGSFREFKPEGSLLVDRFKSFQRRNIIEPRNPVTPHRRYKRKVFVKRSYKTDTIKDFNPRQRK